MDSQHKGPFDGFDGFDDAIRCAGANAQALSGISDRLVVETVHGKGCLPDDTMQQRFGLDAERMLPALVSELVVGCVGEIEG